MNGQHGDRRNVLGMFAALLALLVLGLTAPPVEAKSRKAAVAEANAMIENCFEKGGEPEVIEQPGGGFLVRCTYPDGKEFHCLWIGSYAWVQTCNWGHIIGRPVPVDDLPVLEPADANHAAADRTAPKSDKKGKHRKR